LLSSRLLPIVAVLQQVHLKAACSKECEQWETRNKGDVFRLLCKSCNRFATTSDHLRLKSNVSDDDELQNFTIVERKFNGNQQALSRKQGKNFLFLHFRFRRGNCKQLTLEM